jgi:restriction system protein
MTSPTTLIHAARHVLEQAGTPLHTQELTRRMLDGGHWHTQGRTPEASVYSALFMNLKRQGQASGFVQTAPSTFGLRSAPPVQVAVNAPDPDAEPSDDVTSSPATKTFLDAAEAVLIGLPAGETMSVRDLTRTALDEGLLTTNGLTPVATMSAQLFQDVERRRKRGIPQRFERLPGGFVRLATGQPGNPSAVQDDAPTPLQGELLARLRALDPRDLELLVQKFLAARRYVTVEVTPPSNDGGIDLRAEYTGGLVPERIAVQVKRLQANVRRPEIQALRGSLATHERGLFITTGGFQQRSGGRGHAGHRHPYRADDRRGAGRSTDRAARRGS